LPSDKIAADARPYYFSSAVTPFHIVASAAKLASSFLPLGEKVSRIVKNNLQVIDFKYK
jgi:hypothetical protein